MRASEREREIVRGEGDRKELREIRRAGKRVSERERDD